MTRLLILIVVALVMASATLGWMLRAYLPGAALADIFFGLTPVLKLLAILALGLFGAVLGMGVLQLRGRDRRV